MRYYLEGVVFGVICILLIKLLLSITVTPRHYMFIGNRMKIPRLAFIDWMSKSEIN